MRIVSDLAEDRQVELRIVDGEKFLAHAVFPFRVRALA
jgi:hypothetical protein